MDPVTAVLLVGSTLIGGYSAYQAGQAQKDAYQYQAAVAQNNQAQANEYAAYEIAKGQREEVNKRIETQQRMGAVRAAAAASGLDVDDGSPLRLQEDTAILGEFDALTIRSNAARTADGFRKQGANFGLQSQMDAAAGRNAGRAGSINAVGSIIGGAAAVSDKWSRWRENPKSPFYGGGI